MSRSVYKLVPAQAGVGKCWYCAMIHKPAFEISRDRATRGHKK